MTLLRNKSIPMNAFMQELLFLLLGISPWHEYGEDGKKRIRLSVTSTNV